MGSFVDDTRVIGVSTHQCVWEAEEPKRTSNMFQEEVNSPQAPEPGEKNAMGKERFFEHKAPG